LPPERFPAPGDDTQDDGIDEALVEFASCSMRRKARIIALSVLYEIDIARHVASQCLAWDVYGPHLSPDVTEYAQGLVQGVLVQQDHLDAQIQHFAPAWPVAQLSPVDRTLLRMAIYEVTMEKSTPQKAAINEAVELAKAYGSESSPRFINGVLGSVMDEAKR
jgi:N utilization substance protein B